MTPLRQAAAIIIVLMVPGLAGTVQMEGSPTEPAFQADRVYQVSNPDSIDLSTGSLTLTIPIGGSYPVGGDFSYGLILSYSSLIWDFDLRVEGLPDCDPPYDPCEWYRQAFPSRRSNAGIGWRLSLGELYSPVDPDSPWDTDWAYVSPDGGEHVFFETLHHRDSLSASGGYSYWYSRDGSYLRMKFQNSPPTYETRWIEHPDGTTRTFQEYQSNRYRLTRIEDRHGNYLNIGYVGSPVTQWTLTDRHGREHHVNFTGRTSDGEPVRYVSSVQLEAFEGATATYSFTYASTTIDRSLKDSDPETSLTTSVPLLTGIGLPDGTTYSMPVLSSYHTTATGELRDLPGVIKKLVLPTLGIVEWTWQKWWTPGVEWIYPDTSPVVGPEAVEFCRDWVGVEEKIYRDRSGSDLGTWSYTTWTGVAIPNGPADLHTERRTVVTSPELDDTVYYFRALPADGGLEGQYQDEIIMWDYALPYTRRTSVSDPKTGLPLYLSVEYYDGAANYNATPVTGDKKRSVYVRYENSHLNEHLVTGWDFNYRHLTRHQAASRTTYDDDGGKYRQITSFDFDGLGHYRTTVTDGTLGGAVRHKSYTNFNPYPVTGTYKPRTPTEADTTSSDWYTVFGGTESPGDSFTMWPAASAWVIGTSTYAEEFELDVDGVVTYGRTDTCFDAATGKVLRSRKLKDTTYPGSSNANDVLTVNAYNVYGDLNLRSAYGADLQSIGTGALCSMALPGSTQESTFFTYQYGSMATATPNTAAGAAMSFKLLDRDIDLSTGLPLRSRDSSGLPTEYAFDSSGRLTWIKPTGQAPGGGTVTRGAWAQHCYFNAAGSALAEVEVMMRPNGVAPLCTDTSNVLARSSYTYDDLGRLAGEYTLLPGTVWNQRLHGYNGMGWKVWETEWQLAGEGTLKKTTYSSFDPFGRPTTITPADGTGHNVTIAYTGERRVQRTVNIGTSRTGSVVNETSVTTTDLYDGVGRLWKRTEPSSPSGTDVTTVYTYDALGRLRNASTTSGVTQVRDWSYDGRGFLLSETVPEKGGTGGYGTVSYSSYDVRGQAGRVIDGPNDLSSSFDDAGRLTSVTETGPGKVVRSLTYGTANTSGNLANGKLTVAEAGNYYDGTNNFQFRETYTYGGTDGRVSQRVTLGGIVGGFQGTFTLGYTWSPLGDLATVTYPQKAGVGAARTVTNTYSNGFLTKVAQGATNFASSISYHTNATVNRVTYGNNVWLDHAKDPNDMARPSRITLGNATSSWDTGSYGYDGSGNIITMTGSATDTFVYDKVGRVKEARQYVGGLLKTQSYAFDTFGNLSAITTNGTPRTLAVDALTNRISGSGYDAAGSMTSWGDGGTTYSYAYYPTNEMKQMIGDGRTTLFGYSADGERVGSYDSVAGGITYVLRGLDNKPLRQYKESGGVWSWEKDWVYRDGLLLATIETSGTKYFHVDHLGTPRRITNSSRVVIASHDYYPFGEEITASAQDSEALKFTGHERDLRDPTKTTDDLDYMHARYYNPWLGRFLSTDPVGGTPETPQSWNRYSYVQNSPVNATDPDGRWLETAFDIGMAAISIRQAWRDPSFANIAGAALDVGAVALPAVPALAGRAIDAAQAADKLVDTARAADAAGDAARGAGRSSEEAVEAAGKLYPNKAGKIEQHHVTPKYLGGILRVPQSP